jgi:hypothetical protein
MRKFNIGDKVRIKNLREVYRGYTLPEPMLSCSGMCGEISNIVTSYGMNLYKLEGIDYYWHEYALELADPPEKADSSLISFV